MMRETITEELRLSGGQLIKALRNLLREGNLRRLTIRGGRGEPLLEVPVTVGVLGAVLLPAWTAAGLLTALLTGCTVEVQRAVSAPAERDVSPGVGEHAAEH